MKNGSDTEVIQNSAQADSELLFSRVNGSKFANMQSKNRYEGQVNVHHHPSMSDGTKNLMTAAAVPDISKGLSGPSSGPSKKGNNRSFSLTKKENNDRHSTGS